jgi:lipoate-protein ligase A
VYKNGVFVGSDTFTSYSATSTNVSIGGTTLTGNAGDVIKGSISNVMVYNVELDLTQISNNFNAQKNRYGL